MNRSGRMAFKADPTVFIDKFTGFQTLLVFFASTAPDNTIVCSCEALPNRHNSSEEPLFSGPANLTAVFITSWLAHREVSNAL